MHYKIIWTPHLIPFSSFSFQNSFGYRFLIILNKLIYWKFPIVKSLNSQVNFPYLVTQRPSKVLNSSI